MSDSQEKQCQEWMAAAQTGDKATYAKLLGTVETLATRYLATRLAVRDDANDLVQEILMSIHKARPTYDAAKPFYPWMYAIFRYRLQDYLRRYYRLKARETGESLYPVEGVHALNPEEVTSDKELSEKLLSCLKPKQRRIVELLYLEGNSAQEVSDEMKISVPDVRTSAHRAMKELRKKAEMVG
ncbi:MAG: sigma-70 family RNA polymerase sigma factor [Rickettsiales bacterium]|nr:sigma-70 family RNA polymerase sigma factor [Rickettsiales bacterium]